MSRNLRPILEQWGPPARCSLTDTTSVLLVLARDSIGCAVRHDCDLDSELIEITQGNRFLEYLARRKVKPIVRDLRPLLKAADVEYDAEEVIAFVEDLCHFARAGTWNEWVTPLQILTFRIDTG